MGKTLVRALAISLLVTGFAAGLAPSVAAAAGGDETKIERLVDKARKELAEGRYKRAVDHFDEADALAEGTSPEALAGLADALLELGQFQAAIDTGDRLLDIATDDRQRAKAHHVIGLAFFGSARETMSDSILTSTKTHGKREDVAEALRSEAETLRQAAQQEFLSSADAFRRVLELTGGGQATPWVNYAEALYRGNRHDAAREILDRLEERLEEGQPLPKQAAALRSCLNVLATEDGAPIRNLGDPTEKDLTPPKRIDAPQPHYTSLARQNGVQGAIVIQAIIDTQGRVVCPDILRGLPYGLNDAALDAILDWRFEPATLDGEPVHVYYNLTVSFAIQRR